MKVIGLSGGIAAGKDFVAKIFADNGVLVFDADKEVHNLLKSDKSTIEEIKKYFSRAVINEEIDRRILGEIVFADDKKLKILESIIHPKVRKKTLDFLSQARISGKEIVVLNVPLLLEGDYKCDKTIAIISSLAIRKQRFLEREKLLNPEEFLNKKEALENKFNQVVLKQISDEERIKKADFVIDSSGSKNEVEKAVTDLILNFFNKF